MNKKRDPKAYNKVFESRFGFTIDYDNLTPAKARKIMGKITEAVNTIRKSSAIHTAERNPKYLEMLMVYESLDQWMTDRRQLNEGEMGQAEILLAAKDMVDTIQTFVEKVGKMQNEQLPALYDSIRDQIGIEQADAFRMNAGQVLGSLSQTLNTSRDQIDQAARSITGENAPMDMGGAGGMQAAPAGVMPGADVGVDDMAGDDFSATDAAAGGTEGLGRELR